jgi:spore coat polysaccharide biosynthesis protein SpsF
MKVPVFISVRSASTRLPEKCFLPFGSISVLEHVIKRSLYYGLDPIVCTTREASDDAVVELAKKCNVKFFRGPDANKLLRWSNCCEHFKIDSFHSVDADDPFFCGDEVKRSYKLLKKGFDMVAPSPSSANGGASVGYSLTGDIIKLASFGLDKDLDTEMMWSYVEQVPNIKKTTLTDPQKNVIKERMTLDYYEDYIFLESIRLLIGNMGSRKALFDLLSNNPDLSRINAFRSKEWSENQKNKSNINNMEV